MSPPYLNPYREAQEQHGSGFNVTLWANERTQRVRFEVFSQMVYLPGKRILDAGCSRADFAAFLLEREIGFEHYTGVDGLPEVIAYAKSRGLPKCEFVTGDFVTHPELMRTNDPQIIVISGTLNTMDNEHAFATLEAAWAAAGESLVFNFLSDTCGRKAPTQQYPARRLPTMKLIKWAFEKTWDVRFRQDYLIHGHDATIVMHKD